MGRKSGTDRGGGKRNCIVCERERASAMATEAEMKRKEANVVKQRRTVASQSSSSSSRKAARAAKE